MTESMTLDARGLSCPQPVLETKRAIEKVKDGTLIVLVDTATSRENVKRFAENAGWQVEARAVGDYFEMNLQK